MVSEDDFMNLVDIDHPRLKALDLNPQPLQFFSCVLPPLHLEIECGDQSNTN